MIQALPWFQLTGAFKPFGSCFVIGEGTFSGAMSNLLTTGTSLFPCNWAVGNMVASFQALKALSFLEAHLLGFIG